MVLNNGASLNMDGNDIGLLINRTDGDNTANIVLRDGQQLLFAESPNIVTIPFSLLATSKSQLKLPQRIRCSNVNIHIQGNDYTFQEELFEIIIM